MNKERILEVARCIEKSPKNYDQTDWGSVKDLANHINGEIKEVPCGSAGCVAGWTCAVYDQDGDVRYEEISDQAEELLDLDAGDAGMLFDGEWPLEWADEVGISLEITDDYRHGYWVPTAEEAVKVLNYIGEHGHLPCV